MKDRVGMVIAALLTAAVWLGLSWWFLEIWKGQPREAEGRQVAAAWLVIWGTLTVISVFQGLNRSDRGNR